MASALPIPAAEIETFDRLSRWADEWLGLHFPDIAGIDPETCSTIDVEQIKESIRTSGDTIERLGEIGPQFCAWCEVFSEQLTTLAAGAGGVLTLRLGFVNDQFWNRESRYRVIPVETHLSAHAAAAEWVSRVGQLLFGGWDEAVREQYCFTGPYFCEPGDDPDGAIRDQQRSDVALKLQRVCWGGGGENVLSARMTQERILFFDGSKPTAGETALPADIEDAVRNAGATSQTLSLLTVMWDGKSKAIESLRVHVWCDPTENAVKGTLKRANAILGKIGHARVLSQKDGQIFFV